MGNLEGSSSTRDFARWMKGALGIEVLSLKRPSGEGLDGAPLMGALEDVLRKAPDTGVSLHRSSFTAEENLEGRTRIHGTLKDE